MSAYIITHACPFCACVGFFPAGDFPYLSQPTGVPLDQLQHIGAIFSSPPEGITLHPGRWARAAAAVCKGG